MLTVNDQHERIRTYDGLTDGASVSIDKVFAQYILDEVNYEKQRPLNQERALLLASAMEHGTFLQNTQISFGRLSGRLYLVNGQHRMQAVTLAAYVQLFRVEIYECRTDGELDALYCRFDQPGSQRSMNQVSRALGLHDEEEGGLRPGTAALLLHAVPLLMVDLKRIAKIQRPRAVQFWSESIRNSRLGNNDPRYALHSHFLASKRSRSEYELAEAACNAWNAFFRNKSLTVCKSIGSPLKLLGTPYTGEE